VTATARGALSRRDQNKAATRKALIDAAMEQTLEKGFSHVTVDAVVDQAGVSRRTFFNYFPSLEDCIATPVMTTLHEVMDAFNRRPASESLVESATIAFAEVFNDERVPTLLRILHPLNHDERLVRSQLVAWHNLDRVIAEGLRGRHPDADELWIAIMARAMLSTAQCTVDRWVDAAHDDPRLASAATLNASMRQTFTYLQQGLDEVPTV